MLNQSDRKASSPLKMDVQKLEQTTEASLSSNKTLLQISSALGSQKLLFDATPADARLSRTFLVGDGLNLRKSFWAR